PSLDLYTLSLHDALPISLILSFLESGPAERERRERHRRVRILADDEGPVVHQPRTAQLPEPDRQVGHSHIEEPLPGRNRVRLQEDRKSTRLNSSHVEISY